VVLSGPWANNEFNVEVAIVSWMLGCSLDPKEIYKRLNEFMIKILNIRYRSYKKLKQLRIVRLVVIGIYALFFLGLHLFPGAWSRMANLAIWFVELCIML
jgi:hypothetical protein